MPTPTRWPLHPFPQPQESLSSWLDRLALSYNLTLDDLLTWGLGVSPSLPHELDRDSPADLLRALSVQTGVSPARLHKMTLRSYVPWILDTLDQQDSACLDNYGAQYRTLLPARIKRRPPTARTAELRAVCLPWLIEPFDYEHLVCAMCLCTDAVRYHRLFWRLGMVASCPSHGCLLEPLPVGDQAEATLARHMGAPAHRDLLIVDRLSVQALTTGIVHFTSTDTMNAAAYCRFLRSLIRELLCRPSHVGKYGRTLTRLWEQAGVPRDVLRTASCPFELLALPQRRAVLQVVGWLLRNWPESLAAWQSTRPWKASWSRQLPAAIADGLVRVYGYSAVQRTKRQPQTPPQRTDHHGPDRKLGLLVASSTSGTLLLQRNTPERRFSYCRISSLESGQENALPYAQVDQRFVDVISSQDVRRPQLDLLLSVAGAGDTVVAPSMDRLARNFADLRHLIRTFMLRGVQVEFVKERLTLEARDTRESQVVLSLLEAVADFKQVLLRERQRDGIDAARKRGAYHGRKPALSAAQAGEACARVAAGVEVARVARELHISRQTLYGYLRSRGHPASERRES